MFDRGKGVQQDFGKAAEWYRKAADQNDARAQVSLAFYYSDKGVAQDEAQAVKWFQKAAAQNEASAYPNLAWAYYQGTASHLSGEERERVSKVRDVIASKLTPDQLAQAQELARNWQPKK